eukprot:9271530-Alexandrium_andersonii.AAC.1
MHRRNSGHILPPEGVCPHRSTAQRLHNRPKCWQVSLGNLLEDSVPSLCRLNAQGQASAIADVHQEATTCVRMTV